MSKTLSTAQFERNYWNSVKEYTISKFFGKYIKGHQTINLSEQLHALWQSKLKVYPTTATTTAISLNNAVMLYVINDSLKAEGYLL